MSRSITVRCQGFILRDGKPEKECGNKSKSSLLCHICSGKFLNIINDEMRLFKPNYCETMWDQVKSAPTLALAQPLIQGFRSVLLSCWNRHQLRLLQIGYIPFFKTMEEQIKLMEDENKRNYAAIKVNEPDTYGTASVLSIPRFTVYIHLVLIQIACFACRITLTALGLSLPRRSLL